MEIMFEKCLRDLLAKHRKTQSELAEYLCISTQAVSKRCRGENMSDIALLPKIASFLNVSVDEGLILLHTDLSTHFLHLKWEKRFWLRVVRSALSTV